jgi:hypothetical protein
MIDLPACLPQRLRPTFWSKLPNKALQLTSHSAFQSVRGRVWHRT